MLDFETYIHLVLKKFDTLSEWPTIIYKTGNLVIKKYLNPNSVNGL